MFRSAFCAAEPSRISEDASVLIVGTGLSMADVVVTLSTNHHQGKVTAISRRGIIPKSHNPGQLSCHSLLYALVK